MNKTFVGVISVLALGALFFFSPWKRATEEVARGNGPIRGDGIQSNDDPEGSYQSSAQRSAVVPVDSGLDKTPGTMKPNSTGETPAVRRSVSISAEEKGIVPNEVSSKNTRDLEGVAAKGEGVAEEARDAYRNLSAKQVDTDYARFFQLAGLGQNERIKVLALLTEESERNNDVIAGAQNSGLTVQQREELLKQSRAETDTELKAFLSDDTVAQLADYRTSRFQRKLAMNASSLCEANGAAMSAETVDALTKILYQSRVLYNGKQREVTAREYDVLTQNDGAAIMAASRILSPRQIELLKISLGTRMKVRGSN